MIVERIEELSLCFLIGVAPVLDVLLYTPQITGIEDEGSQDHTQRVLLVLYDLAGDLRWYMLNAYPAVAIC